PPGELPRDLAEIHHSPGAGRTLDTQAVTVEVVITLERLDEEVIDREPDGAAPVGVAAEERGVGFGRCIVDPVLLPIHREPERALAMHLRERADAVRREELVLVEHVAEGPLEPLP